MTKTIPELQLEVDGLKTALRELMKAQSRLDHLQHTSIREKIEAAENELMDKQLNARALLR